MIETFLTAKKTEEVYNAIIDKMMELEMNIPESWKPDWATVINDVGNQSIMPIDDVDPKFDEVLKHHYSFTRMYSMLPKRIYKQYCDPLILIHDCDSDRIKYCHYEDPGVAIRDWHENDLGTNVADAFMWWLKSSYFKDMFSKMQFTLK